MRIMNLETEKLELIRMVLNTKKSSVLTSIRRIFEKEESVDFWNTMNEEEKEDIRQGIEELDRGEKYPYDDIIAKYQ